MVSINNLPPETLHEILRYLPAASLRTLSLTSPYFHTATTPVLYRSIHHTLNDTPSGMSIRIPLLIRTLIARPNFARFVKELDVKMGTTPGRFHIFNPQTNNKLKLEFDNLNDFDDAFTSIDQCPHHLPRADAIYPEDFQAQLQYVQGNSDAMFTLLLSMLPNLEVLTMDFSFASMSPFLRDFLQHSSCTCLQGQSGHHGFRRLRTFRWTENLYQRHIDFRRSIPWWPVNIETLETLEILLPRRIETVVSTSISLSNLTALILTHPGGNSTALKSVFSHTPNLATLEYCFIQDSTECCDPTAPSHKHENEWEHFKNALYSTRSTLKSLVISVDFIPLSAPSHTDDPWLEPEDPDVSHSYAHNIWKRRGCLGSLKNFTALRKLEMPIFILLGWDPQHEQALRLGDVLPDSVEELYLRDDLVDLDIEYEFPWTPWYRNSPTIQADQESDWEGERNAYAVSSVGGGRYTAKALEVEFEDLCNPTLVINEISNYTQLRSSSLRLDVKLTSRSLFPQPKLRKVVIKNLQGRAWPLRHAAHLTDICTSADIDCLFHCRMTNFSDEVRETTVILRDKRSCQEHRWVQGFRQRLIWEKRRTFYGRPCEVSDESELIIGLEDLVKSGWFENVNGFKMRTGMGKEVDKNLP